MVYDGQHRSMLETDQKLAGLDSLNPSVKPNADGSYTMWFGPLQPFFDKTWRPGDFEPVDDGDRWTLNIQPVIPIGGRDVGVGHGGFSRHSASSPQSATIVRARAGVISRAGRREMIDKHLMAATVWTGLMLLALPAWAGWSFSGPPSPPNAFIQTGNMTLELHCDRIRFAPAGYEDAQDIERKQGLSLRFLKNGSTESGAFQAGSENADIRIVDNYPVEIIFRAQSDYDFVLDQLARNAALSLAMIDADVTYGIFDLEGSAAAIKSLRSACAARSSAAAAPVAPPAQGVAKVPEGVVYCGGGAIKRQIEFVILANPSDQWDAWVTVNGEVRRAMTSYSYFGKKAPPRGFVVALLGEDRSEFLVFHDGNEDWLEFGDYTYRKCN